MAIRLADHIAAHPEPVAASLSGDVLASDTEPVAGPIAPNAGFMLTEKEAVSASQEGVIDPAGRVLAKEEKSFIDAT